MWLPWFVLGVVGVVYLLCCIGLFFLHVWCSGGLLVGVVGVL